MNFERREGYISLECRRVGVSLNRIYSDCYYARRLGITDAEARYWREKHRIRRVYLSFENDRGWRNILLRIGFWWATMAVYWRSKS